MTVASRVAVVTGASSGIGQALVRALAREGYKVGLLARRGDVLQTLAQEITAAGGVAAHAAADVSDHKATVEAIHQLAAQLGPVDLLIANAGVGVPSEIEPFNVAEMERLFQINFFGVLHAIDGVLPEMLKRGSGHLAAVSSLAAYRGMAAQQAYTASKAAINNFFEGLRVQLRPRGIAVTTICPGFVWTPMTEDHPFKMPFLLSAEKAATRILRALKRRKKVFNFPLGTTLLMKLAAWAPDWIMARLAGKYVIKPKAGLGPGGIS
jgi:short-subunit dehydrogenase